MRSSLAKTVALAFGLSIIVLSAAFAIRQNPGSEDVAAAASPSGPVPPFVGNEGEVERGRSLFVAVGCTRCHSAQGQGNRRYPLDDVGARRRPAEIRQWMLAVGSVADSLPRSVVRAKQRFSEEGEDTLAAIEIFLVSSRGGR